MGVKCQPVGRLMGESQTGWFSPDTSQSKCHQTTAHDVGALPSKFPSRGIHVCSPCERQKEGGGLLLASTFTTAGEMERQMKMKEMRVQRQSFSESQRVQHWWSSERCCRHSFEAEGRSQPRVSLSQEGEVSLPEVCAGCRCVASLPVQCGPVPAGFKSEFC